MTKSRKFLSMLLVLLMVLSIIPISSFAATYVVNGKSIPLAGKAVGTAWGYTDCWNFAQQVYQELWPGNYFTSYRGTSDDMLRNVSTGTSRAITAENTKNFITFASLGATIRVTNDIEGADGNGTYLHSMILIQKDANGFTIYDSWNGQVRIQYFTWSGFASSFSNHKYFKYIKWPGAGQYIPTIATTGISLDESAFTLEIDENKTVSATVTPANATNKTVTWSSSDTSVATVSGGMVKGIKAGVSIITAKASGGQTATCKVVVFPSSATPTTVTEYNGHLYELYDYTSSWKDAKEFCEAKGGHLVTITSKAENDFVYNLAQEGSKARYCLGATDEINESSWKWVTGENFSYSNFQSGENTDSTDFEAEDYLFMYTNNGQWGDVRNYAWDPSVNGFICEYDKINAPVVDELPEGANPNDYDTVIEYRSRDKETTTSNESTMSGWTLYDTETTYGSWGSVQSTSTKPTESDTLQITGTWTQYHYYHYVNYYDGCYNIDSIAYGTSSGKHTIDRNSSLSPVSMADQGGKQAYGSQACSCGFNYWFLSGTTTYYNYQTRSKSTTNCFYRWSNWSTWTETPITATSTKQVETRTVYRLKEDIPDGYTGLYKFDGTWRYVKNGELDNTFTGLTKHTNGIWYYVQNGQVNWSKTGLVKHTNGKWYYVQKGEINWNKTGLVKHTNGKWYYVQKGEINWSKTGLVKHTNGIWYYVQKGEINWSKTGLVKHTNGIWYYVQKGQINWNYTGLVKHTNGVWYYVQKGQINWKYTGLVKQPANGKWYYVQNGQVNWNYTGTVTYNGKKYKVVKGVKV